MTAAMISPPIRIKNFIYVGTTVNDVFRHAPDFGRAVAMFDRLAYLRIQTIAGENLLNKIPAVGRN